MIHKQLRKPFPRVDAYDLYWRFAHERQAIFERRVKGADVPWTTNTILLRFKFCNVYRASDRVSQYLIHDVAYDPTDVKPEDRLFQITAFRLFSKNETWNTIIEYLGAPPTLENLRDGSFADAVGHTKKRNGTIYTAAFILCATNAFGQSSKHENHVELLKYMFLEKEAGRKIADARSLQEVYTILRSFPLIGDFMAYQLSIDLNYSNIVNHDENEFTQPGPGALRGIRKAFCDLGDYSVQDVIQYMVENQEAEFNRLGLDFKGLWGRSLHAIDCQGLFCELDKYCRQAIPELASNRTRIKSKFAPSPVRLKLFYPPKWGINDLIPIPLRQDRCQTATSAR